MTRITLILHGSEIGWKERPTQKALTAGNADICGLEGTEGGAKALTERHNFAYFTSSPLEKRVIRHELLDCGWTEADQRAV
jgi:hypothetical protein